VPDDSSDGKIDAVGGAYRLLAIALVAGPAVPFLIPAPAHGHEIPSDVTIRVLVRPDTNRLQALVRAPLEAMQDIDFPTFGQGYLDAPRAEATLHHAAQLWLGNDLVAYEDGVSLGTPALVAVRASIPSDRSFATFETALDHVRAPPLPAGTELVWQQALLDALFEWPIESPDSLFAIEPRYERLGLRVVASLMFTSASGTERVFSLDGSPGPVVLDPSWYQAFGRFLREGFLHILDGRDHLLFLLCLVLPLRRNFKALVWAVTAFTLAHSATLAASAFGLAPDGLWFPPLIETLIAASILYMALENILAEQPRMRWAIAFGFGLIHGFGFSFALRNTLQFAGSHVLTSLFSFNLGVELAQILVLIVMVLGLNLLLRMASRPRIVVLIISALVAHTAWHWLGERYAVFRQYDIQWTRTLGPADRSRFADAIPSDPVYLRRSNRGGAS
jgi:HupE / UreJ protein